MARLFVACLAVAHALYDVRTTYGVTYARGLTNCTNGTNCREENIDEVKK